MILKLMKKRASVRSFSEKEIKEKDIKLILESARHSPSGGNMQPYIFGLISKKEYIHEIAELSHNQQWIKTCNKIIALCIKIGGDEDDGKWLQKKRFPEMVTEINKIEKNLYTAINLAEHQTKIPGTIMMLQALELGIYSTWISLFDVSKVKQYLNLPDNILPSELIAFGYPMGKIKHLEKKALKEMVFYEKYTII